MTFLIEEAISRGQARAIAARPNSRSQSVDHGRSSPYDAAIVYVWDNERCYYWLSTYRIASADNSNAKPHPDATKLLAVKAMEDAQAMNLIFDADGVTTPGAENLYRNIFGLRTGAASRRLSARNHNRAVLPEMPAIIQSIDRQLDPFGGTQIADL